MFKHFLAGLALSAAVFTNAADGGKIVYKTDFKDWKPFAKGSTLKVDDLTLTAVAKAKMAGMKTKLAGIKASAKTVLNFEWKCKGEKVNYTAFAFTAKGVKEPYYIWFTKNAATGMEHDKWFNVSIPMTELQTVRHKNIPAGSVITGFKVFQSGTAPHEVSIRNFRIIESEKAVNASLNIPFDIRVWPRRDTIYLPAGLRQFMFMEFANAQAKSDLKVYLTLPAGITVEGFPKGSGGACLPPNRVYPKKWQQNGNIAELEFAANTIAKRKSSLWLPLSIDVKTAPGDYVLKAEVKDGKSSVLKKTLKIKIYKKLSGKTPKNLKIVAWQYAGLDYKYVPTYVNMLKAAGFNMFCNMHGDAAKGKSISDYIKSQKLGLGLVFFTSKIKYVEEHFGKDFKNIKWDETWLLDHPEILKKVLTKFIDKASGGRKLDTFVYDAESGSFRRGKIHGDLSPYSLEVFRKFAKIPASQKLTPEIITKKYVKDWIKFRCHQSNQFATIIRDYMDEKMPDTSFGIYSGYEYDNSPFKDRTRMFYSVDWKSISDTGLDYGGTGYGGSMEQIKHTANTLKGKAVLMPAEMYLVNFHTKGRRTKSPEVWGMRLINAFLNSGMKGGLSIWYGNDLDGSALISINMAAEFMRIIEPYALKGKRDDKAVKVYPASEENNVYVLRKGGNVLLTAVNNEDVEKTIRIRLQGFRLKGFTGELQVSDLVTGEKIKAKKVLRVKVKPYSYRLINLLDDGN